jgi:hypothetical protein
MAKPGTHWLAALARSAAGAYQITICETPILHFKAKPATQSISATIGKSYGRSRGLVFIRAKLK